MGEQTYVCKRLRLCNFLKAKGFEPYRIAPDRNNPKYNVFLFHATQELRSAVVEYLNQIPQKINS